MKEKSPHLRETNCAASNNIWLALVGARLPIRMTFSAPGQCGWRSGRDSSSDDYFAPGETSGNKESEQLN